MSIIIGLNMTMELIVELRDAMKGVPGKYLDKLPQVIEIRTKFPRMLKKLKVKRKEVRSWKKAFKKDAPYRLVRLHTEVMGLALKYVACIRNPSLDHGSKQFFFTGIHGYFRGMLPGDLRWDGTDDCFFVALGITREEWGSWLRRYALPN